MIFKKNILDCPNLLKIPFLFFSRLFFFLTTESMFPQWKLFEGVSFIAKYFSHCAQVFPLKGKVSCDANPLLFLIKVLAKPILRLNHLDRPPALSRKSRFQIYVSWNPNFVVVAFKVCAALLWVAINCFPKLEILLWMDNSRIYKTTFSSLSLLIDECCPDDAQAGWRTAGATQNEVQSTDVEYIVS